MTDDTDLDITKGNALIRHCFGMRADDMDDDEWSQYVAEAMWLMGFNAKLIAVEVSKIFSKG